MRENAAAKATRLLAEGRVVVVRATAERILGYVRGDSAAFYWVEWIQGKSWTCTCPAIGRCSHAIAVQRVTATEGLQVPLQLEPA